MSRIKTSLSITPSTRKFLRSTGRKPSVVLEQCISIACSVMRQLDLSDETLIMLQTYMDENECKIDSVAHDPSIPEPIRRYIKSLDDASKQALMLHCQMITHYGTNV